MANYILIVVWLNLIQMVGHIFVLLNYIELSGIQSIEDKPQMPPDQNVQTYFEEIAGSIIDKVGSYYTSSSKLSIEK